MTITLSQFTNGTSGTSYYTSRVSQWAEDLILVKVDANQSVPITIDKYESLRETASILGDKKTIGVVRRSLKQLEQGKTIPWEEVKRNLGL